ncbi:MAG: AlpA family phage regulatory protein [Gammaproteobacteria bacterium]|nr:AlpA family phage regulatory protein [Gammaproteobacteria bacterium]
MTAVSFTTPQSKKYLSAKSVSQRLEVSIPTIWRWTAAGKFPKPQKLSPGCTRWDLQSVEAWETSRGAA